MYNIIQTIEETIASKKSQIKYHNQEIARLNLQIGDTWNEITSLQQELTQLKAEQAAKEPQYPDMRKNF